MTTLRPKGFDYQHCYVIGNTEYYVVSKYELLDNNDIGYLLSYNDSTYIAGYFKSNGDFLFRNYILSGIYKQYPVYRILYQDIIDPVANEIIS